MKNLVYFRRFAMLCAVVLSVTAGSHAVQQADGIKKLSVEKFKELRQEFFCLDISAACNRGLSDDVAGDGKGGWTDQGENDMRAFPVKQEEFMGVKFRITDPEKNNGNSCIVLRGQKNEAFPASVSIPVNRKAGGIYFMHTAAWTVAAVGTYTVTYADGSKEIIPVRDGREIADWWGTQDQEESVICWQGVNPKHKVSQYLFAWKNPFPQKDIQSIEASTPGDKSYLMILGITLTDAEPALPVSRNYLLVQEKLAGFPVITELPDPFLMKDGSRVKTRKDWDKRRGEIKKMLSDIEYGKLPPVSKVKAVGVSPDTLIEDGAVSTRTVVLAMGPDYKLRVNLTVFMPAKKKGPFALVINCGTRKMRTTIAYEQLKEILERGYVIVEYDRADFDKDNADRSDGVHALYPGYDYGTIAVWAWGIHRILDYFLSTDYIDPGRIAVTGHSRCGKTALLAGALDERITLVNANGSGTCGAATTRFAYPGSESLAVITFNFPYWFIPGLSDFRGSNVVRLPFDQHFLIGLVAPRAFIATDGYGDNWANPRGTQQSCVAAKEIFSSLGAADRIAACCREGGHDHGKEDWAALIDFADKIFYGKNSGRDFGKLPFDGLEKAFSWKSPGLLK